MLREEMLDGRAEGWEHALCAAEMFRWVFLGRAIFYQIEMTDTGLAVIIYEASELQASRAPSTSTSEH